MLPQFGLSELLLVGIVALIVVGPKDLPIMMRRLGQFVAKGRAMANEFRAAFDDIAKQAELDELRQEIEALKRDNEMASAAKDLRDIEQDINASVMLEHPQSPEAEEEVEEADPTEPPKADPS